MGNRWWWSFVLTIFLCMVSSIHVDADSSFPSLSLTKDDYITPFASPKVELDPVVEYLGPHKTTTLWQIPRGPVKRVLFIAIASGTLPWEYWDRSPSCPLCRGLPETRKIVLDALSQRYAVVLISPLNFGQGWEPWPQDSPDLLNAMTILSDWKERHGFVNTSTVALGASAGGHALSTLGLHGPELFDSMVVMVSKGVKEAWRHVRIGFYPPTLFVHCPRDSKTAEAILIIMDNLRRQGIPADEVPWNPHPITPTWLSQLIPGVDPPTSRAIYDAFKRHGSILDENDYLIHKVTGWQIAIRGKNILPDDPEKPGQVLYKEAIDQEMRVAYAMHSTLARRNEEIFRWFEGDHDVRPNVETRQEY
ncbi:unnamed protein product [Calypogeia fissa]